MPLDQRFIKSVLADATYMGPQLNDMSELSVDSRTLKAGQVFVALKGTRVDGHDYIAQALTAGAAGIIMSSSRKDVLKGCNQEQLARTSVILMLDVHEGLVKLATAWRAQFTCPVIGITGSIGKTSTKEMLANILALNGTNFIASHGNQNTALGLSLNLLRMRPEHQVAIFEMGVSRRGEMALMAEIVRPTTAIITSIGHCHMEGLGSLVDIANEKRDIFKFFKEDNIGIIHGDQPILANISYTHPIVKFGYKTTNQVQARKIQSNNLHTHFVLKLYKERYKIVLDTNHAGRVINSLASSAAAYLLGIPHSVIVQGVQVPISISGRFESTNLKAAKGLLINDCYNASPESMKAALLAFEKVESKGQKIAVLGDMLELGVNSPFWHRQLGRFLRKVPSLHHVVLVGDWVKWTKTTLPVGLTYEHVADWQAAKECVQKRLDREAVILVKGSRAMGLSQLVTDLIDAQTQQSTMR